MNNRTGSFLKNFAHVISSNLVTVIVSVCVVFIIPRFIGVEAYGYWQLFLFYSSYVPFLQIGWSDGVYLRYGGKDYHTLTEKIFFSQFWMLFFSQCIVALLLIGIYFLYSEDKDKIFIVQMTAIFLILVNVRYLLIYILQATNRLHEYSNIIMIDRIIYIGLIFACLVMGIRNYEFMIVVEIISKLMSLLLASWYCKNLIFQKITELYFDFSEAFKSITAGIALTISNTASMLIIGVVRLGIEHTWDISTFGKISLTLNISSFMMVFFNAVGIVLFPILKKRSLRDLTLVYADLRLVAMSILLGLLILYYPIKSILEMWIPQYSESFQYMALLFPICIFEGEMALLIRTYFNVLRKERLMLLINIITMICSIGIAYIATIILKDFVLAIGSIIFSLGIRSLLAEFMLLKIIKVAIMQDLIIEWILLGIFIIVNWLVTGYIGCLWYLFVYILYLIIKKNRLIKAAYTLRLLIKE